MKEKHTHGRERPDLPLAASAVPAAAAAAAAAAPPAAPAAPAAPAPSVLSSCSNTGINFAFALNL